MLEREIKIEKYQINYYLNSNKLAAMVDEQKKFGMSELSWYFQMITLKRI